MLRKSILTLLVLTAIRVNADDGLIASATTAAIDEITVTAARRPVDRVEVSSALSVIGKESARFAKLVTDSLSGNVGVYLQQTTPGQGAAIVRGLRGSALLHLVDGMRLNNAIFRSAPTQYFALVPVSAVEQVEVVRGTPTSLYGSDAVGGVIQLVTRVPQFDSAERQYGGEVFASLDTAELARTIRATFDVGTKAFATSLSAEYLSTGDRRGGSGGRIAPSAYASKAARLLLSATPDGDRSWLFDFHALEQPDTPRVDELVAGFGQSEPSSSEFSFSPNRRLFAHARYEQSGGWLDLDWRLDLAWQRIDDDRTTRDFEAADRRFESNRSDLFGFTVSGTRQTAAGSWIAGAEYYDDRVASSRTEENLLTGGRRSVQSRFPDGSTVRQAALFGNVLHRLASRHSMSGGLRVSRVDVDLPAVTGSVEASINASDLSGDLGWIFDLTGDLQLVANVGFGFRAPNVFDVGSLGARPGNRFNIPNPDLASEQVSQADLGLRWHTRRLNAELTLYSLRYDDRITSVSTGEITPDGRDIVQSRNAARASIRGAEAGAELQISDSLRLQAVVNYTRGEQEVGGADEPSDRIPPLNGRLSVGYDSGKRLSAEAWVTFSDRQDRLSERDVRDVRIDPAGTAGWGSVGGRFYWNMSEASMLTLAVDNVFDRQYRVHGSGIDAVGRNLSVGFRHSW